MKKTQPVDLPVVSSSPPNELAAAFAEAAGALMKIAAALSGNGNAVSSFPKLDAPNKRTAELWGVSVLECCNEFLVAKARKNVSDRYLRQIRVTLSSFAKGRTSLPLAEIDRTDVEKWIYGQHWSPRTMRGHLATLKTLYQWAKRRGWIEKDLATWIELPSDEKKPIHIHTPDEVRAVLEAARFLDLGVMRLLAIRYFAGVRSAEAHRLREENILLDHGVIEITAAKSKTKRRRIVKITPNLSTWLALGGVLIPTGDATVRSVITRSGVQWSHNVTRHTWESYSVALHDKRERVAKEAGHSASVQTAHYDAVALPKVAAEFFNIYPDMMPGPLALKKWGGPRYSKRREKNLRPDLPPDK